jgi:hypothetical protein
MIKGDKMKLRIKQYTDSYSGDESYEVQKKSFFGFWYALGWYDNYVCNRYSHEDDAIEAVKHHFRKTKTKIIYKAEG